MKDLRVAMLIQSYLPHVGGAERQIAALAPLLEREGCEIHVLTRRFHGLARFERMGSVSVHRLPVPGPKAVASLSFTLSALSLLKKLRPHVIHAHELLSPATTAVAAKRAWGIPVVAKVLRGGILGDIAKLRTRTWGERRLARIRKSVDAFAVISQEIDNELECVGVPAQKRRFIPNGVDTERFTPVTPEEKAQLRRTLKLPEGPLVVYSGRLAPEKRVDQLVKIWPAVRQVHPHATLLVLGEGEVENVLRAELSPGVELRGRVEDVAPYLQTADLFVLPSTTEGLSNALLEAAACSLAVVATPVGGTPDVITDAENGLFVAPDSPLLLKNAISTLLTNPRRAAMMGMLSRQRIQRNFSLYSTAMQLSGLYRELIGASRLDPIQTAVGA